MRKAIITNKSNIDSSWCIQLTFSILLDDVIMFEAKNVYWNPLEVIEAVTKELQKIKEAYENSLVIETPLEITL